MPSPVLYQVTFSNLNYPFFSKVKYQVVNFEPNVNQQPYQTLLIHFIHNLPNLKIKTLDYIVQTIDRATYLTWNKC